MPGMVVAAPHIGLSEPKMAQNRSGQEAAAHIFPPRQAWRSCEQVAMNDDDRPMTACRHGYGVFLTLSRVPLHKRRFQLLLIYALCLFCRIADAARRCDTTQIAVRLGAQVVSARQEYEQFRRTFGSGEVLIVRPLHSNRTIQQKLAQA